jgi:hypothetical protein
MRVFGLGGWVQGWLGWVQEFELRLRPKVISLSRRWNECLSRFTSQ